MATLTNVGILKQYFSEPKLTMAELKVLSKEERSELADLAGPELGYHRVSDTQWSNE